MRGRLNTLDDKLAHAISETSQTNSAFSQELKRIQRTEYKYGQLLTGRHVFFVLYRELKLNEDLGAYFSVQDIMTVQWIGDRPL